MAEVVAANDLVAQGARRPADSELDAVVGVSSSPRRGDQPVGADGGIALHALAQHLGHELGQHDGAHAGPGLRDWT